MIDAYCTQGSHLQHIVPIWRALAPERRGDIYVDRNRMSLLPWSGGAPLLAGTPPFGPDPVIVGSGGDLDRCGPCRPVVLLEHGAGQTYLGAEASPSYSGGAGRDAVRLFLAPNEVVAARNFAQYPSAEHVVVGAPALGVRDISRTGVPGSGFRVPGTTSDLPESHQIRISQEPVVVVTWHWRAHGIGVPEALPAWEEFAGAALQLAAVRPVLGHAHPRAAHEFLGWWAKNGVQTVTTGPEALAAADVLVVDNSSLGVEAMRLGIPVVWLNAPWYRRDVEHGGRFWQWAEGGVQCDDPDGLGAAVDRALAGERTEMAERIGREVFPTIGQEAADLAVDAIERL